MFGWIKRFWNAATSTITSPAQWFVDWVRGGTESASGVTVNDITAIGWAPVWYAISRIAGHVSTLPITPMVRLVDDGKERGAAKDKKHSAYRVVRKRANPFTSAAQFWETITVHALLYGNGKAAVIRSGGRVSELLLIHPKTSVTAWIQGEKWHAVRNEKDDRLKALGGTETSVDEPLWMFIPDKDVLHVPGLGLDGTVGLCVYEVSQDTFGIGLGAEQAASADFKNGSRPGVLLQVPPNHPNFRDEKDAKKFLDDFNAFHSGPQNRGKAGMLREGITATMLAASNEDAQWVEQRKFQRQEVALLFSLESILGDDESVSYSSTEAKDLAYLKNCLAKWLTKIEQECDEKLLTTRQKRDDTHFFKFNTRALLRTDFQSTVEAISSLIVSRVINPNEAREILDMNPYDGGDEFANPAITPGEPGQDETEPAETTPEDANRAAIVAHLSHLIEVETKQVLGAAGNKRNYTGWLSAFYDGKWRQTITRAVESVGGSAELANAYCDESKAELQALAGSVPDTGLADAVSEVVESWPQRAEVLAAEIVGELVHV